MDADFASPSSLLQQLKPSSPEFVIGLLRSILYGENYAGFDAELKGHEALAFIDVLDQTLDIIPSESHLYHNTLRALRKICGQTRLLPTTHMLSEGLKKTGDIPAMSGGFADVWKGTLRDMEVAIKALSVYNTDDLQRVKKLFCEEVVIWRRLSHPNVLPFLGVSTSVPRLAMVSEWMPHGNISHYVAKHPEADRLQLLLDVANGLQFLHMSQVVHGDLKGSNILINNDKRACLVDFGFVSIVSDLLSMETPSGATLGSARWMAPELFNLDYYWDVPRPTEASDIYALAMVIVEVFGGNVPFHQYINEVLIFKVIAGLRPDRPAHPLMSNELWEIVQTCWLANPAQRPKITVVLDCLKTLKAATKTAPGLLTTPQPEPSSSFIAKVERFSSKPSVPTRSGETVHNVDRLFTDPVPLLQSNHGIPSYPWPDVWEMVQILSMDSEVFLPALELLTSKEAHDFLQQLQGDELVRFINILDRALDSTNTDPRLRKIFLRSLCKACGQHGVLPTSYVLSSNDLLKKDARPYRGGFADVWLGDYIGHPVAIKTLRIYASDDLHKVNKRFCKEAVVWKRLSHPNVLRFLGVFTAEQDFSMVSDWMPHGNIVQYISQHPNVDRLQLIVNIVNGLLYLHENELVHGDLKGVNILINSDYRACLADFGLTKFVHDSNTTNAGISSTTHGGTTRWLAPELLEPEAFGLKTNNPTKRSDVYALAMVFFEVFTSKVPFHECTRDVTVIRKVMSGERPARPSGHEVVGLSDAIWKIMKRCWRKDPSTRASVQDVLGGLLGMTGALDSGEQFKISGLASGFKELVLKRSW